MTFLSSRIRALTVIALALGAGVSMIPGNARAQQQTPPGQAQTYETKELKSYVQAAQEVRKVGEKFAPQVNAAKSSDELRELNVKRMEKMVEAVESQGLSVEKYNEIYTATQSNPELAQEVQSLMNDLDQDN